MSAVSSYFLSKTLVELPRTFLANLIFSSILYPSVGLRWGAEYFFLFVLTVLLVTLVSESTAYLGTTARRGRWEREAWPSCPSLVEPDPGPYRPHSFFPTVSAIAKTSQEAGALAPIFIITRCVCNPGGSATS